MDYQAELSKIIVCELQRAKEKHGNTYGSILELWSVLSTENREAQEENFLISFELNSMYKNIHKEIEYVSLWKIKEHAINGIKEFAQVAACVQKALNSIQICRNCVNSNGTDKCYEDIVLDRSKGTTINNMCEHWTKA